MQDINNNNNSSPLKNSVVVVDDDDDDVQIIGYTPPRAQRETTSAPTKTILLNLNEEVHGDSEDNLEKYPLVNEYAKQRAPSLPTTFTPITATTTPTTTTTTPTTTATTTTTSDWYEDEDAMPPRYVQC